MATSQKPKPINDYRQRVKGDKTEPESGSGQGLDQTVSTESGAVRPTCCRWGVSMNTVFRLPFGLSDACLG